MARLAIIAAAGTESISKKVEIVSCIVYNTNRKTDIVDCKKGVQGSITLPELPYDFAALEPVIDAKTMEIHHDKHHATYVDNLNKALADYPEWAAKSLEDIVAHIDEVPEAVRTAVRNNGGGHYNHSLFWQMMTPEAKQEGATVERIEKEFGSFEAFQKEFAAAATGRFGSGWA